MTVFKASQEALEPDDVDLALTRGGRALLTFDSGSQDARRFWHALRPRGGAFGSPVMQRVAGTREALEIDADGNAISIYRWFDGDPYYTTCCRRIAVQIRARGARRFGASQQISHPELDASPPALAVSRGDGRAAVAWEADRRLFIAERRPGRRFGPAGEVGPAAAGEPPMLGYDGAGTLIAVWRDGSRLRTTFRPRGGRFHEPTAVGAPRVLAEGYTTPWALAVGREGHAVAAWVTPDKLVAVAERRPGAMRFGSLRKLRRGGTRLNRPVHARVDATGRVVVAWVACSYDQPFPCEMTYSRRTRRGRWTVPRVVSAGYTLDAALAMNDDGAAALVWLERAGRFAAVARPGEAFGATKRIAEHGGQQIEAEIDRYGNAHVASVMPAAGVMFQSYER